MKKLFFVIAMMFGTSAIFAGRPTEVSEKVFRLFHETFKNPKEVSWRELDMRSQVYFKQGDITNRGQDDADGNIIQYIRNYSEDQLPFQILSNLKKKYTDRSIFGVTEFFSGTELNYFVTMEDSKHWYTVKLDTLGNLEQNFF